MAKVIFKSTFDAELLGKAKERAKNGDISVSAVIEDALKFYFTYCLVTVWEKKEDSGWVKKLVIRPDKVTFESIRSRKLLKYSSKHYADEMLLTRGWKRVWKPKNI